MGRRVCLPVVVGRRDRARSHLLVGLGTVTTQIPSRRFEEGFFDSRGLRLDLRRGLAPPRWWLLPKFLVLLSKASFTDAMRHGQVTERCNVLQEVVAVRADLYHSNHPPSEKNYPFGGGVQGFCEDLRQEVIPTKAK